MKAAVAATQGGSRRGAEDLPGLNCDRRPPVVDTSIEILPVLHREDRSVQGRVSNVSVSIPTRVALIVPLISAGSADVLPSGFN